MCLPTPSWPKKNWLAVIDRCTWPRTLHYSIWWKSFYFLIENCTFTGTLLKNSATWNWDHNNKIPVILNELLFYLLQIILIFYAAYCQLKVILKNFFFFLSNFLRISCRFKNKKSKFFSSDGVRVFRDPATQCPVSKQNSEQIHLRKTTQLLERTKIYLLL